MVLFFSVAYCLAQFVIGGLADRFGGRLVVFAGMTISACATLATGFSSNFHEILACQTVNGAAQASGWLGLMKMMKQYPQRRNGVTMAWWSTNYVMGGVAAVLLATYALDSPWLASEGWRKAAWFPAVLLLLYALIFLAATRGTGNAAAGDPSVRRVPALAVIREAFANRRILVLVSAYFFVKLIRYSLLFWLPLYLLKHFAMTPVHAGYASSQLEGFGVVGVLAAGYLSDYVFHTRRFPVAMLLTLLLSVTCMVASSLDGTASTLRISIIVALLGCATYGADTILVGAAAQDAARPEHMGTIAGIVDGAGSTGQVLSPLLIAFVSDRFGWPAVFQCLAGAAFVCSLLLASNLPSERKLQVV